MKNFDKKRLVCQEYLFGGYKPKNERRVRKWLCAFELKGIIFEPPSEAGYKRARLLKLSLVARGVIPHVEV